MFREIKKSINKSYITLSVILLTLAVILQFITGFKIIDVIKGPQQITSNSLKDYEGEYVEVVMNCPIEYYEYSDYTISYITYDSNYDFYYGVEYDINMESTVDKILYENYQTVEDGKPVTPSSLKVRGSFNKINEKSFDNFEFMLMLATGSKTNIEKTYGGYYIENECIDGMNITYIIIISIISAFFFILSIAVLIIMFVTNKEKGLLSFVNSHSQYTLEGINESLKNAQKIGKHVFVLDDMTIITTGIKVDVIYHTECKELKDNVDKITLVSYIKYVMKDGKTKKFSLSKKDIKKLKLYYDEKGLDF